MRNILVFQHVGHEPLGTLNPMLKAAGFRIRYVNFGRDGDIQPSLDGYNGLVVLGGPMGVYETYRYPHLLFELKMIERALKQNIPVLGICLGAQMIASVLGAKVVKASQPEFGWYKIDLHSNQHDQLFSKWGENEFVFQAHQDQFELPTSVTHLASSNQCPGQAFRFGEKVYGLQFHLEADRAMIHRWLNVALNKKWLEQSGDDAGAGKIVAQTDQLIQRSLELSDLTFTQFISLFQLRPRQVLLGSGHGKPTRGGL